MTNEKHGIDTLAVHGGKMRTNFREHVFPIFQTSTYAFDNSDQAAACFAGEENGYLYTRLGNPNYDILQKRIALLEGGDSARVFPSGMAAITTTIFCLLKAGDHLITDSIIYGCTDSMFRGTLSKFGVEVSFIDTNNLEELKSNLRPNTKAVFFESVANPTVKVADIANIAKISHEHNPEITVIADNTFATPVYIRPLEQGADMVIHSCSKYIGGHGDVVAGAVIYRKKLNINFFITQKDLGTNSSPFDTWLLLRGLKTLPLRMRQHTINATQVAEYLSKHPLVEKVRYPGFSGMMCFELKDGVQAGKTLMDNVKLITLAVSLGNVDSLICHPASTTHSVIPKEQREKDGITDGLVRLSIGIENVEDIIADLDQALGKIKQ